MSTATSDKRKVGEIRPSQLLYNYGVGSVVELPNLSVMVMGLDDWPVEQGVTEISEPRLLKAVQYELGPQVAKLLTPPVSSESTGDHGRPRSTTRRTSASRSPRSPAGRSAPTAGCWPRSSRGCSSLRLDPYRKDRSRYVHRICKKPGKPPTVGPGPVPRRLRARAPRRLPVGRVRPPGQDRLPLRAAALRTGGLGRGRRHSGPVRQVRGEAAAQPRRSATRAGRNCARCQGPVAPPAEVRRGRLRGAAAGDPARGLEQLVPDHAVGPVDPVHDRQAGPTRRVELGRTGGVRERPRGEAQAEAAQGARRLHRGPDLGGGRQAEGGQRSGRGRVPRPAGARVGGLLGPRPEPQRPGLQAPGRRAAQGVPQAS